MRPPDKATVKCLTEPSDYDAFAPLDSPRETDATMREYDWTRLAEEGVNPLAVDCQEPDLPGNPID